MHVVDVPAQVLHNEFQLETELSIVVVEVDPEGIDATEFPEEVTIFIPNDPVEPVVEGFKSSPKSTPNCPELVVPVNNPDTVIVVCPLAFVPTVHVILTVESNKSAQVFNEVDPPVFVEEIVTSEGNVITTTDPVGILVSAVNITL